MAGVALLQDGMAELLRYIGWIALALSALFIFLIYHFVSYKPARVCFIFVTFLFFLFSVFCLLGGYL
ncbi:hypothetical protein [Kluyvera sichuanensis]|uniref:hypothetical protein n=1 Tax=Kluyvera sichuanensis TaxID=2725494 RepID=UPI0039F5AD14